MIQIPCFKTPYIGDNAVDACYNCNIEQQQHIYISYVIYSCAQVFQFNIAVELFCTGHNSRRAFLF